MQRHHVLKGFAFGLVTVFALAFLGAASAQMGQQSGALEREFMEIQQRLAVAQQKAIENNPQLQEMSDAVEALVTEKMTAAGYDLGGIMETMQAAQARMERATTDAQRREIMESREVREAQQEVQEAQNAAMADPDVQSALQELEESMLSAMRQEEPELDRMIERLQQIQREAQQGGR